MKFNEVSNRLLKLDEAGRKLLGARGRPHKEDFARRSVAASCTIASLNSRNEQTIQVCLCSQVKSSQFIS